MAKFNIDKTLEQILLADIEDQIVLYQKFKAELTRLLLDKAKFHDNSGNRFLGLADEINVTLNAPNGKQNN